MPSDILWYLMEIDIPSSGFVSLHTYNLLIKNLSRVPAERAEALPSPPHSLSQASNRDTDLTSLSFQSCQCLLFLSRDPDRYRVPGVMIMLSRCQSLMWALYMARNFLSSLHR